MFHEFVTGAPNTTTCGQCAQPLNGQWSQHVDEVDAEIAYETAVAAAYRAFAHWQASKPPKGAALSSLRAWDRLGSEARTLARLAGGSANVAR